ncbi:gasdermin-E-like isoform X2 [Anabas testudineus]|uniref:gasdermin-E-like isoform X2 n=1 Tax=Anabas testudineus TaxID=64144 RepID=UPI000E45E9A8|nr:gasdermin-E-like isoform X2 [Anabas testudineus]
MFSKATANFVRQVDPEGSLIHVSRVNDSHKLAPMALVVKRNRFWKWQRPKYQPTDFTLSDLLLGDNNLSPGVHETDFLTYEGTFGDKLSGKLNTEAGTVSVTLEERGTSKLQSCFGKLKKEELDVKKLLRDSSDRLVNMQHVLVQQLQKRAELLAVVKERILTTNSCLVKQTKKQNCTFQGVVGLIGMLKSSIKASNNREADSDVSVEIPSGTVIAYSILELEIKRNGQYDICLQPGTIGGFEADVSVTPCPTPDSQDMVDGSQDMDLCPLADLPLSAQHVLFKGLQETMRDRTALSYLQCQLQDLRSDKSLGMSKDEELSDSQRQSVSAILDQLNPDSQSADPDRLKAAHLLVSAMEELPDETLSLLSESHPALLEALDTLMCRIKKSRGHLPIQCIPPLLQDNQAFPLAEQLLSTICVTLRRDTDRLWMETENKGFEPLLLGLIIHGLSLLNHKQ